eukprot:CAMPEP_0179473108 /NCGR_PEP_ID=MMETSP0799-20121207/52937_1 /TAXON_ID=46947 /ORGANISM="Geminigera cryophila, Strain CCMP2564" /LENGTH=950 /DNA_ID=CAMNT_0021281587 /DNA_START=408 /DNA_END=3257 /DNA_ORIENTATION=-
MSALNASQIAINNYALQFCEVTMNQVIKSAAPMVVVMLSISFMRTSPTMPAFLLLCVNTAGVTLAIFNNVLEVSEGLSVDPVQCFNYTSLHVLLQSIQVLFSQKIMSDHKITVFAMVLLTGPGSFLFLLPFCLALEISEVRKYCFLFVTVAFATSFAAVCYNLVYFKTIQRCGGVGLTILSNIKVIVLLICSKMMLREQSSWGFVEYSGCAISLVASGIYSGMQQKFQRISAAKSLIFTLVMVGLVLDTCLGISRSVSRFSAHNVGLNYTNSWNKKGLFRHEVEATVDMLMRVSIENISNSAWQSYSSYVDITSAHSLESSNFLDEDTYSDYSCTYGSQNMDLWNTEHGHFKFGPWLLRNQFFWKLRVCMLENVCLRSEIVHYFQNPKSNVDFSFESIEHPRVFVDEVKNLPINFSFHRSPLSEKVLNHSIFMLESSIPTTYSNLIFDTIIPALTAMEIFGFDWLNYSATLVFPSRKVMEMKFEHVARSGTHSMIYDFLQNKPYSLPFDKTTCFQKLIVGQKASFSSHVFFPDRGAQLRRRFPDRGAQLRRLRLLVWTRFQVPIFSTERSQILVIADHTNPSNHNMCTEVRSFVESSPVRSIQVLCLSISELSFVDIVNHVVNSHIVVAQLHIIPMIAICARDSSHVIVHVHEHDTNQVRIFMALRAIDFVFFHHVFSNLTRSQTLNLALHRSVESRHVQVYSSFHCSHDSMYHHTNYHDNYANYDPAVPKFTLDSPAGHKAGLCDFRNVCFKNGKLKYFTPGGNTQNPLIVPEISILESHNVLNSELKPILDLTNGPFPSNYTSDVDLYALEFVGVYTFNFGHVLFDSIFPLLLAMETIGLDWITTNVALLHKSSRTKKMNTHYYPLFLNTSSNFWQYLSQKTDVCAKRLVTGHEKFFGLSRIFLDRAAHLRRIRGLVWKRLNLLPVDMEPDNYLVAEKAAGWATSPSW